MEKNQKILIILIAIFAFIIVLISLMLFMQYKEEYKEENQVNISENTVNEDNNYIEEINDEVQHIEKEISKKLSYVDDRQNYYTIKALTNNYINSIGYKNNKRLMSILSPKYISNYNITDRNIFNMLSIPQLTDENQYYMLHINDMLTAQIDKTVYIYIVKGKCRIVNTDTIFDVEVMIEINAESKLYNVYPYQYMKDNGIDKLTSGDPLNNYLEEEINDREDNQFNYINKTDAEMAKEYFNNYVELLNYYQEEAYNKLNLEYSQNRFGSKESFDTYLKDNKIRIALMSCEKYKVNSYENYIDYICSDKYDNIYIFRQQGGVMRYSVFLDNYTVMLDEYMEEYNKLDKFDKGKYNLTKFINMVNTKDYNAIYNVLDTTFRTNNFKTRDDLKQFIQDNMYDFNSLSIIDIDDKTYEYYVFSCKITNMRNNNESKNMTVIINQTDGKDFTMSFSFE